MSTKTFSFICILLHIFGAECLLKHFAARPKLRTQFLDNSASFVKLFSSNPSSGISRGERKIKNIIEVRPTGTSGRRKMGPPQRKLNSREENKLAGRVSVYCVGAALDLQALRAHVFRRGFGQNYQQRTNDTEKPDLVLTRDRSLDSEIDDEVLHVSNAPLFISPITEQRMSPHSSWTDDSDNWGAEKSDSSEGFLDGSDDGERDLSDAEWKARENLLMATQDIFYFDYGCVVFWGLSSREEKAALAELAAFTIDPVSDTELDSSYDIMEFVFDRKANPQRPIRFDRMRLRSLNVAEKLALSYAMAQSSKLFVFESKVLDSVEKTRYLPQELAKKGRINNSKKELNKLIGQLFVEQTEVNLFSSILDTPDFLWDDDEHLPAYQYTRSYLEVDARVTLVNSRLGVIRDLLDVLTAQVADSNSTRLEWIIIWLISVEIVLGIASNPIFAGKRVLSAMLVPTAILLFRRLNIGAASD
jgi:uncharacterized Rmd1/YagE family protein